MLHLIERAGRIRAPGDPRRASIDLPEHRAVARRAAAEGIVLLQNEGRLLPLDPAKLGSIAIIGPNAKTAQIMGGGSAHVNAHYAVTPFEGITAQLGRGVKVGYEIGCTERTSITPLLETRAGRRRARGATTGFADRLLQQPRSRPANPCWQTTLTGTEPVWLGDIGPGVDPQAFSARTQRPVHRRGKRPLIPSASSPPGLVACGLTERRRSTIGPRKPPATRFSGRAAPRSRRADRLTAGQPVELVIEYSKQEAGFRWPGCGSARRRRSRRRRY